MGHQERGFSPFLWTPQIDTQKWSPTPPRPPPFPQVGGWCVGAGLPSPHGSQDSLCPCNDDDQPCSFPASCQGLRETGRSSRRGVSTCIAKESLISITSQFIFTPRTRFSRPGRPGVYRIWFGWPGWPGVGFSGRWLQANYCPQKT